MKNYKVNVIDKKTNTVLEDKTEMSYTKKYLQIKYRSRYNFHPSPVKITIERYFKKPGTQVNLIDMIDELTK